MGRAHEVRKVAMAKTAAKKAKLYSRYGKEIYLAAKAGGPEPDGNLALRRLIEKAKKEQVPADVIKRAIDKVKSGVTENYEEKVFEGYANGGATLIVKCLTDNINRTISSVRPAFTKSKAKLGNEGSVSYLYDVISVVAFKGLDEETVLDALVMAEVDAQDIVSEEDGTIKIIGEPTDLYKIKEAIEGIKSDIEFEIDEIQTLPQDTVELEGEDMELFEHYKPDVVLYDVLGDVVCGGFAAPIREGYADKVLIVTSGEKMALYAANNISSAVRNFEDRSYARVFGIVLNHRNVENETEKVQAFSEKIGVPIVGEVPRSDEIIHWEEQGKTVIEGDPTSRISKCFFDLAALLWKEEEGA